MVYFFYYFFYIMSTEKNLQNLQEQQSVIPNATGGEKRGELKEVLDAQAYPRSDEQQEIAENLHAVLRPDGRIDISLMDVKWAKILSVDPSISQDNTLEEAKKIATEQWLMIPERHQGYVLSQQFKEAFKSNAKWFATLFWLDPSVTKVCMSDMYQHAWDRQGDMVFVTINKDNRLTARHATTLPTCPVFACEEIEA